MGCRLTCTRCRVLRGGPTATGGMHVLLMRQWRAPTQCSQPPSTLWPLQENKENSSQANTTSGSGQQEQD